MRSLSASQSNHCPDMLRACLAAACAGLVLIVPPALSAQDQPAGADQENAPIRTDAVLHDGFEGEKTLWLREEVDAPVDWLAHDRTQEAAREGTRSERFIFKAGPGSGIYASYAVPKINVTEDLSIGIHIKADHPGITLLARIIFPNDKDPDTGKPSFVVVAGSAYSTAGTWQRLSLRDLPTEMERQARLLRIRTQRKVPTEGAYLERVILNLYGGPGETTVYVDDLRISPVEPKILEYTRENQQVAAEDAAMRAAGEPRLDARRVVIEADQLKRDGLGWVFSLIDAPGARSDQLLRVGFDVLSVSPFVPREFLVEASQLGYMFSPRISQGRITPEDDPQAALQRAMKFSLPEVVAFWDVGRNLGVMPDIPTSDLQLNRTRELVGLIHEQAEQAITEQRPFSDVITGSVAGLYTNFSKTQNKLLMMGIDPTDWSSGKPQSDILAYFTQRRNLASLDSLNKTLFWGMISTRSEPSVIRQLWGTDLPPAWGYPRRLPEQIRIDAFTVFASGYKGWGVKGDADITRDAGRSALLELAFLNEEFDLIESFLSMPNGVPVPIDAHPPDPIITPAKNGISDINTKDVINPERKPHASVRGISLDLPRKKGRLLLVADYDPMAQWQPGQMSINNLTLRVPGSAENATPYLISPGEVRVLERKRAPGGIQIVIPEFDTSAIVLLTSDETIGPWLSTSVARNRAMASTMAIEQAERQYNWVVETHNRLTNAGEGINDAELWLSQSQERLLSARDAQAREDFAQAWNEARRALRPLRILMREHWNQSVRNFEAATRTSLAAAADSSTPTQQLPILFSPISSPGLMAFNTLPQANIWTSWIRDGQFSGDGVSAGHFDDAGALNNASWVNLSRSIQGRIGTALAAPNGDGPGKVLRLNVSPGGDINQNSVFVDHLVAAVRTHPVKVNPREFIRIRVKVRMPRPQQPGAGGLVIEDSLGGPALAFRRTEAIPEWSEVVLYRRTANEKEMTVTLGLAGDGDAFFDDLRVERLTENAVLDPARIASRDEQNPAPVSIPGANPISIPAAPASPADPAVDSPQP